MKRSMLILVFLLSLRVSGQDLHFSHFMQAPMLRGAAEAGNFSGDLRIAALQRRQWASVTEPFRSLGISVDGKPGAILPLPQGLGTGLTINYDKAGDGELTMLEILLSVSYQIALNKDSVHFLRAGISGGMMRSSINYNALYFDNQFNGDVFQPQSPSGEVFRRDEFTKSDFGFSIGWRGISDQGILDAGLSFMHLNRAETGWLSGDQSKFPVMYQFTVSGAKATESTMQWLPAITLLRQDQNTELTGGTELLFRLKEKPIRTWAFSFAAFYRYRDAVIPQVALYYDKFRLGFSYDINLSGLREASNGRGGAEFSLVYIARKIKNQSRSASICPVY
jgi:type IX secretion system PorP/SprF family membrane protein